MMLRDAEKGFARSRLSSTGATVERETGGRARQRGAGCQLRRWPTKRPASLPAEVLHDGKK